MGEVARRAAGHGRRHSCDTLLAYSASSTAEDVHAASRHELRGNALADAGRVGHVLQLRANLEAFHVHHEPPGPPDVSVPIQTLPADVCGHRNHDR